MTDTIPDFRLDSARLSELAAQHHTAYVEASPFPHIVLDDVFPAEWLHALLEEFPRPDAEDWKRYDRATEKKLESQSEDRLGPRTRNMIAQLNSSAFLLFLEQLSGIEGLIPDPHLEGGGLHQIESGGRLAVHADFSRNWKLKVERRLNVLVYLNEDWEESYGGYLELWDRSMTRAEERILPLFNRCVIFNTDSTAYHGHPDPLTCPEDRTRKSLALYYYTVGRPKEKRSFSHSTLWRARPGESADVTEVIQADARAAGGGGVRGFLKRLTRR